METQTNNNEIDKETVEQIIRDQQVRCALTRQSHYLFFHIYFNAYVKYPTADFQREMFRISESTEDKFAVIVAFRGSAKSTIMTTSLPIWAVLGILNMKCIIIACQTQQQARTHLANIKRELESNALLRADLGPFKEETDEWGALSISFAKFNARIIAVSSEQSIRGIRHGANRPDLIICDDVEDLNSVKTSEGRDKTYNWLTGEVLPTGDKNTKVIIIGNLLHEDSLLMRLRKDIEKGKITGVYREYPLVDENGVILWTGMYPDMAEIEKMRKTIGNEVSWQREYCLKILPDGDTVVKREWIKFYDELPKGLENYTGSNLGVDLAISESDKADKTAVIMSHIYGYDDNMRIYILPRIINKRIDYPTTLELLKNLSENNTLDRYPAEMFIEEVAYQKAIIQQLECDKYAVHGVKTGRNDKRARLTLTSSFIQSAKVLFPKEGAEELIKQLVYFGAEKHDDLADALCVLVLGYENRMKNSYAGFWNRLGNSSLTTPYDPT